VGWFGLMVEWSVNEVVEMADGDTAATAGEKKN
jgi:hypothetical protein